MGAGYSRQSAGSIVDGQSIQASHFNNEFNAIVAAFSASGGHDHDGTLNGGAQIPPAGLVGVSSDGIVARISGTTFASRTLTGPAAGISVTNGDGVSGNPTLALANDLAAVEGLSSSGIAVRTASDTWAIRAIAGTSNQITVSNGNGVSGAPTISLPSALTAPGSLSTTTTLTAGSGFTVTTGGASITGNSTITGTLGGLTGLTVASGSVTLPSGVIALSALANIAQNEVLGRTSSGSGSASAISVPLLGVITAANASASRQVLRVGGVWTDVASASTVDLGAQTTSNLRITGTTTITSFGSTAPSGERVTLRFAAALTLTHNATSLILPGGASITAAAGDTAEAVSLGSGNWVVTEYQRAWATPAADAAAARQAIGAAQVSSGVVIASGAAGTNRGLMMRTSGTVRWEVLTEATAETGANAGSNFAIARYTDGGALVDVPFAINRATGRVTASGVAPLPQSASGVGQVTAISVAPSQTYSLPAGGTWFYWFNQFTSETFTQALAGVAAGGSSLFTTTSTQTLGGAAWRIA